MRDRTESDFSDRKRKRMTLPPGVDPDEFRSRKAVSAFPLARLGRPSVREFMERENSCPHGGYVWCHACEAQHKDRMLGHARGVYS